MVTCRLLEESRAVQDGAALEVLRREDHAPNPCHGDGARTHGTGLQRNVERGASQPLVAKARRRSADYFHLGMGGWIFALDNPVAVLGQHAAVGADQHRPNRHFTTFRSRFGFRERQCYGLSVIHGSTLRGQI